MAGGPIKTGEVVPQTERLFESPSDPQIQNHPGGFVYKLDDEKRLMRFLIMGAENTYYSNENVLTSKNADCVKRLINDGKGVQVVQMIKEISSSRRNVRQNSLLLAYAMCARSNDRDTKTAAYALLSQICRIPTHLFMFIKYCEETGSNEIPETGTGWGRAHKRAVCSWYTRFEQNPEKLARLITKYKSREKWTHKDLLRLSHNCTEDKVMGFIFSYIINGYRKAFEEYSKVKSEMDQGTATTFQKISTLIKAFDEAARCKEVQHLCSMIREHKLTWEQCNSTLLNKKEVWFALLPHMPIEAMIRNLGRMTSYGMFAENSEDEQEVMDNIRSINIPADANTQEPREQLESDNEDLEEDRPWTMKKACRNFLHPNTILYAWTTYKAGQGVWRTCTWRPNQRITEALEEAFYRGYAAIEPTGKTFYLAVDVSRPTSQPIRERNRNITCSLVAAAMTMLTARTEENCIIKTFSDRADVLDILPTDTLNQVENKVNIAKNGPTDCAQPMIDAIDMKRKDIDVFVIYTDNETWCGNVHPHQALCQYREYSANKKVKLVVCGMCATDFTIADKEDPFMLDIVGFDCSTPWLISEFARGEL